MTISFRKTPKVVNIKSNFFNNIFLMFPSAIQYITEMSAKIF